MIMHFSILQFGLRHNIFVLFARSSVRSFVGWYRQILLPRCLTNGSSNLDETYREYPPAPINDLVRFWRSKVKGQDHNRPL